MSRKGWTLTGIIAAGTIITASLIGRLGNQEIVEETKPTPKPKPKVSAPKIPKKYRDIVNRPTEELAGVGTENPHVIKIPRKFVRFPVREGDVFWNVFEAYWNRMGDPSISFGNAWSESRRYTEGILGRNSDLIYAETDTLYMVYPITK